MARIVKHVIFGFAAVASAQNETTMAPTPAPTPVPLLVDIDILGQSGKYTLFSRELGANQDPNKVMVTMDYLHELDAEGNQIGNTGSTKHSVQTFASTDFTIADPDTVTNPNANRITFSADIGPGVGTLQVETLILMGNQNVGPDSGKWTSKEGDVKWNIKFPSWSFCEGSSNCRNGEVGAFVELGIEVKGKTPQDFSNSSDAPLTSSLGGGIGLELTKAVTLDGAESQMPEGYPKVETKGGKNLFIFRFPKFDSAVVYDPLIRMSDSESVQEPTPAPTPAPVFDGGVAWPAHLGRAVIAAAFLLCALGLK